MPDSELKQTPKDRLDEIEITPEMLEEGFRVLCDSRMADEYLEADKHTVADIYRAMFLLRPKTDHKPKGSHD